MLSVKIPPTIKCRLIGPFPAMCQFAHNRAEPIFTPGLGPGYNAPFVIYGTPFLCRARAPKTENSELNRASSSSKSMSSDIVLPPDYGSGKRGPRDVVEPGYLDNQASIESSYEYLITGTFTRNRAQHQSMRLAAVGPRTTPGRGHSSLENAGKLVRKVMMRWWRWRLKT